MKRTFQFVMAVVFSMALAMPAWAQAQRCEDVVPQAMDYSGLDHTIATLPAQLREHLWNDLELDNMELDKKERVTQAFADAFNAERMRGSVERDMVSSCDPQLLGDFLKSLQSPLARKMMSMEADADTPEGKKQQEHFVNVMRLQSPKEDRVRLVDQLIESQGSSELQAEATVEITQQMRAVARMVPTSKGELDETKALLKARAQKNMESALLFTYRGATDAEMRDYIALYQTEPYYEFITGSNQALGRAIRDEAKQLALELKKLGVRLVKPSEVPVVAPAVKK